MINERDCAAAQYLFFDSGAADEFRAMLRPTNRGRRCGFDPTIFLVGTYLSAQKYGRTHISTAHQVLTEDVPLEWQHRWGIRQERTDDDGQPFGWVISVDDLENVSSAIRQRINYSANYLPDQTEAGDRQALRQSRQTRLEDFTDLLLAASGIPRPDGAEDYAMDSTGIWASERYRRGAPETPDELDADRDQHTDPDPDPLPDHTTQDDIDGPHKNRRAASDATWGSKTSKNGKTESFYGYDLHTLVRVPEQRGRDGIRSEPPLVEAIRVNAAVIDIVEPSLGLVDYVIGQGRRIHRLMIDRHYSYKTYPRWAIELVKRDVHQVLDLHQNDQGFTDWNGSLVAAGWVHCPFTPQHLGTITRPGPGGRPEATARFRELVAEREQYAARLSKPMDVDGTTRWECPALNGKVGCPRRPGTVQTAREHNLLIIPAPVPADPSQMPALCRQNSIGLTPVTDAQKSLIRVHQRNYWGSPKQQDLYGRRTYVEGVFGILKGDTAANKKRGSSLYTGLAHVTLELTIFMLITNLILLRSWHKETGLGDPEHPLLAERPRAIERTHTVEVTEDEYRLILETRTQTAA